MNRYESRIVWHTMEDNIPFFQDIIIREKDGDMSIGEVSPWTWGDGLKWCTNSSIMTNLTDHNIVAWGEFEFPSDWDYNK